MCYFCHTLKKNPSARNHRGQQCSDKANAYSKLPMHLRMFIDGKPIGASETGTSSCSICLDKPCAMTFVPCGHVATCEDCASKISDCPICRVFITHKQKMFFVWIRSLLLSLLFCTAQIIMLMYVILARHPAHIQDDATGCLCLNESNFDSFSQSCLFLGCRSTLEIYRSNETRLLFNWILLRPSKP